MFLQHIPFERPSTISLFNKSCAIKQSCDSPVAVAAELKSTDMQTAYCGCCFACVPTCVLGMGCCGVFACLVRHVSGCLSGVVLCKAAQGGMVCVHYVHRQRVCVLYMGSRVQPVAYVSLCSKAALISYAQQHPICTRPLPAVYSLLCHLGRPAVSDLWDCVR